MSHEAVSGSPAFELLNHARQWQPQLIVVGCDGSPGAQAAVRAVAARGWSPGSEVRVVAQDLTKAFPASLLVPPVGEFVDEVNEAERTQAEEIAAEAVRELRAGLDDKGVTVSSAVDAGDPKQVLVRHAEEFGADCIFTGATGFSSPIRALPAGERVGGGGRGTRALLGRSGSRTVV